MSYADMPWIASYPAGTTAVVDPPHPDMLSAWRATVAGSAAAPCVHHGSSTLSAADVDAMSDALAVWLQDRGLGAADRIAVYLQNDPQWLIALLATWKVGGIAVAVNPMLKARELASQLRDSGSRVLICLDTLLPEVEASLDDLESLREVVRTAVGDLEGDPQAPPDQTRQGETGRRVTELTAILRDGAGQHPSHVQVQATDPAMLVYTSGTTGPSKGAINTHGNMVHNAEVLRQWFSLTAAEVILGVAPLFHVTGTVAHMAVTMATGCSLILSHRFDAAEALRLIERHHATFTIGSITVFIALLNHPTFADRDLSSLSKVASGGAPISAAVLQEFEAATGVYIQSVYGLTETTSPSHITPMGLHAPVDPGTGSISVGLPVPGAAVSVVDPETRQEVAIGEEGEIVIAGPMVVPGYWQRPEETAHAIPDGRLHTGDIGFMTPEGWFFVIDRQKDQINAGGYKVWPREVEDVLYEHHAVREAAVVGFSAPYRGESVKAFVSLRPGMTVDPDDLIAHCRANLAAYKYPRVVEVVDDLPKSAAGKVLRRELRDPTSGLA